MINMRHYGAITSVEEFKKNFGKVLYKVYSLGPRSFITQYVASEVVIKNGDEFAKSVTATRDYKMYQTEFSLLDANVIRNNYNGHYIFTNEKKANDYLEFCKKVSRNPFESDGYML